MEHTACWNLDVDLLEYLVLVEGGEIILIGTTLAGSGHVSRRVITATCINGGGHEHLTGPRASEQGVCGTGRGGSEA